MLIERESALETLSALLVEATTHAGRVALVGGEAGIGKTSLLRHFTLAPSCAVTRPLWGACDPLFTPRPLGPLHDIARDLGGAVSNALARDAGRLEVFGAVHEALGRDPHCVVFEDLHWADEATLDLLSYLGRRIEHTRTLLLVTYRDDELGPTHPLRRLLGALPGAVRIGLAPLSPAAVREMTGARAIDADAVHLRTGGNPFFVTEVLAVGSAGVPPTVRDAVLARAARLPAAALAMLEAAAVVGPRIELWLLDAVSGADHGAIDPCIAAGVLREAGEMLEFRHELARQVVLESLSAARRQALHRRTLQALRGRPDVDLARLAHHADAALDHQAVLAIAPVAARQAAAVSAHREAHAQYARAVRVASLLPAAERAGLLEAFSLECLHVGELHAGIAAREQAIALRRQLGDVAKQASDMCQLSMLLVQVGRNAAAEALARQALELLEPLPPSRELAYAYRTQSFLTMLRRDNDEAIRYSEQAIALATRLGDANTIASALNSQGSAMIHLDYEAGCALLERSRQVGQEAGFPGHVLNADSNLGSASGEVHRFERAERYLANGVAYAIEHEMDPSYAQSWQAICMLHLGRWSEAGELATLVLASSRERAIAHNMAHLALGRLRARRGDAGVWSALDEGQRLAAASGHVQRLAPVHAARAEAAWLEGDRARCIDEARSAYELSAERRHAWFVGELAYWLHCAGVAVEVPAYAAEPYALQIAGRWREAAVAWQALGCPYEQARALAEGDADAQQAGLAIFERLGARPAAESLRRTLRHAGVRGIARGSRRTTREHPFGLTARELQVLQLLCEGLRNADIAERIHRSVRTVDHHLAATFAKIGVDSRLAAIQAAQRAGLTTQSGQPPAPK